MAPAHQTRQTTREKTVKKIQQRQDSSSKRTKEKKSVEKRKKLETDTHREKRLRKKREAERARRLRIREDPEAHELYCKKEKAKNDKRRREGKLKKISELTERERRIRRKKQKEWKRKSRLRKKERLAQEKIEDEMNNNFNSKQARVGRKKVLKNIRKCYRDNKKLAEKNQKLRSCLDTLRKRAQRLKSKATTPKSPKSAVKNFLNGRHVSVDIKKKLLMHEVLIQQMRAAYKDSSSSKFKQVLGRVLCGKVIRKYRNLTMVRKKIVPVVSSRIPESKDPLKYMKKEKAGQSFIRAEVKRFFEENSQIDPGKKGSKNVNGKQVTKHHMNASMVDLHAKFCGQKSYHLCYSAFAKLRPSYCIAPKVTQRNTCACFTHENFALLVRALHKIKIIKEHTPEQILRSTVCDNRSEWCLSRTCESCTDKKLVFSLESDNLNQDMFYMKWETSTVQRINEKTKKPITIKITKKNNITCKVSEAVNLFKKEFESFMAHEFRIAHQKGVMKKLIENLTNEQMVLLIDFSENYSCKYGTEVQSVHFGASREQYTLHTGMLYTSGFSQGFATLSESLRHDPAAIIVHLKKILNFYLPQLPAVKILHFMSDGPTTQYRNRKMFHLVTQYLPQCYPQIRNITYNFSEAGHGKSPADGIGGSLKKLADDHVKYGNDIPDFSTLLSTLRGRVKTVHIDTVTNEEIEAIDAVLPSEVKPFVGTMKMHQYTWDNDNPCLILFNTLSCSDCPAGVECKHFAMGKLDYSITEKARKTRKTAKQPQSGLELSQSKKVRDHQRPPAENIEEKANKKRKTSEKQSESSQNQMLRRSLRTRKQ